MAAGAIPEKDLYDVIVVGGGPAGLTAALYLARARYRVLVLEKDQFGGQITITHEVVNYPGGGCTSGRELTETMRRQAEGFGAEFLLAEATGLDAAADTKTVHTDRGDFFAFGILLATGAHPRTIGFRGEEEHRGRGVAYCATCDGEFFTGKEIFVIGGGYAAAEESVFLTKFGRHVTLLVREGDLTCAAAVAEPAKRHEKITILPHTEVEEVSGEDGVDCIRYRNNETGEVTAYRAPAGETIGVFVFAGYAPSTDWLAGAVALDEQGYIRTDHAQKTSVAGVYAAGDVCIKPLRQVVTATGDGALAATELERYAAAMQSKTGLHPVPPLAKHAVPPSPPGEPEGAPDDLFPPPVRRQLDDVFERMARPLCLHLYLDDRPISREAEQFMTRLASFSDKLTLTVVEREDRTGEAPCVRICRADGEETGLAFHGVPGGHEFTAFILGLYHASGAGRPLDDETRRRIDALPTPLEMQILVSLSCTMCPDLVTACQQIAALRPGVRAEVYDLQHFPALREKYHVMSVPCLVTRGGQTSFGKKNIAQVLSLLEEM